MRFVLEVTVCPGSRRTAVETEAAGLRIHLTAPPVEGKANEALLKLLSKTLSVPKSSITIQRGEHGRRKVIFVEAAGIPEPYLSLSTQSTGRQA